ncbi:hypothetical protein M231_06998 [Tremella mesenterica]|uniref:Uncharacterized protein n=1 Tax=Tremella mesenterica TaxID=5217 RepID=A0A4Q1BCH8_TREME|nr:hypothetical protein M231_06998 [Tremella mesenterica]
MSTFSPPQPKHLLPLTPTYFPLSPTPILPTPPYSPFIWSSDLPKPPSPTPINMSTSKIQTPTFARDSDVIPNPVLTDVRKSNSAQPTPLPKLHSQSFTAAKFISAPASLITFQPDSNLIPGYINDPTISPVITSNMLETILPNPKDDDRNTLGMNGMNGINGTVEGGRGGGNNQLNGLLEDLEEGKILSSEFQQQQPNQPISRGGSLRRPRIPKKHSASPGRRQDVQLKLEIKQQIGAWNYVPLCRTLPPPPPSSPEPHIGRPEGMLCPDSIFPKQDQTSSIPFQEDLNHQQFVQNRQSVVQTNQSLVENNHSSVQLHHSSVQLHHSFVHNHHCQQLPEFSNMHISPIPEQLLKSTSTLPDSTYPIPRNIGWDDLANAHTHQSPKGQTKSLGDYFSKLPGRDTWVEDVSGEGMEVDFE